MKKIGLTSKTIILYIATIFIIIFGDQLTKIIVDRTLSYGASYPIIDNFFYFTYVHNTGAAWGILEGRLNFFFLVSILATIGIVYYFIQSPSYQKLTRFGLILVLSGMIGNLIDRIAFGYVRDFIDFLIFGYNFPIFNVADMAITIGIFLVIFETMYEEIKIWKLSKSQ